MFVRIGADGKVISSQLFPGEEECALDVVEKERAYFFFVAGERIIGAIPVAFGASNCFVAPRVLVEENGIRVVFLNVNGRAVKTEFALLLLLGDRKDVELPSVNEIFKLLSADGRVPTTAARF